MVNTIFAWCVNALVWLTGLLGMTYEEINVYIFVVIWPIFTLALMGLVLWQHWKLRQLHHRLHTEPSAHWRAASDFG